MRISNVINIFQQYAILGLALAVPAILIFLLVYFVGYKCLMKGRKRLRVGSVVAWGCFLCYVFIVAGATLLMRGVSANYIAIFQPFTAYRSAWYSASATEWRNLILNIVMFLPIGIALPLLAPRLKKWWQILGIGFVLTVLIEIAQLVTGRGGFSVDDILNNTLGAFLGYCLFRIAYIIVKKKPFSMVNLVGCFTWFVPFLLVTAVFMGIFTAYQRQEFGNLNISPSYRRDMRGITITSELDFGSETGQAMVFTTSGRATVEETRAFAIDFFRNLDAALNENRPPIVYDESVWYYAVNSSGEELHLTVNFLGMTFTYGDWTSFDHEPQAGASEETIRGKLEEFGIQVPENAIFSDLGQSNSTTYGIGQGEVPADGANTGRYQFQVPLDINGNGSYFGTLALSFYDDDTIKNITNDIMMYQPMRKVDIISEQEAFQKIEEGRFRAYLPDVRSIVIQSVDLDWKIDSKGFLQPVYLFQVLLEGMEIGEANGIVVSAMR